MGCTLYTGYSMYNVHLAGANLHYYCYTNKYLEMSSYLGQVSGNRRPPTGLSCRDVQVCRLFIINDVIVVDELRNR